MVEIAQVAELPDHFGPLLTWPDRVIQRHQTAATARVHQERLVVRVKQQRLVTGQRETTIRLRGGHEDLARSFQLFGCRQMDHRARGTQQPGQGHHHQQHCRAEQRAQAARGIGVEGELPPQLMAVGHVLVREQQQPHRRTQDAGAGRQVDRRER
ncbi:hypothetical protein D3C84_913170 [compost metagenome]